MQRTGIFVENGVNFSCRCSAPERPSKNSAGALHLISLEIQFSTNIPVRCTGHKIRDDSRLCGIPPPAEFSILIMPGMGWKDSETVTASHRLTGFNGLEESPGDSKSPGDSAVADTASSFHYFESRPKQTFQVSKTWNVCATNE